VFNRFRPIVLATGVAVLAAGCGGGSSPTAPQPDPTPAPTPTPTPEPADGVLRTATFESANGYFTEGTAAIVREGEVHRLELREDFRTSQSGALDVRLCRETACTDGDLDLGPIQAFSGAQTYSLPDDGSAFAYVVIWCRAVALPFGFGELQ
jgi:hypothetical protein